MVNHVPIYKPDSSVSRLMLVLLRKSALTDVTRRFIRQTKSPNTPLASRPPLA